MIKTDNLPNLSSLQKLPIHQLFFVSWELIDLALPQTTGSDSGLWGEKEPTSFTTFAQSVSNPQNWQVMKSAEKEGVCVCRRVIKTHPVLKDTTYWV